ncbi:hypothetical protein GP486_000496 [Trichoglossum hirsutum]|uniref:Uncharacterized protein n=1 Tax=Trichoglossum hirsutum TaxID=265104 RepID=A0A9P8LIN9_9PEZI|nr:hypothetical protein GP486_000496 [Trichoglossum hirsutum]
MNGWLNLLETLNALKIGWQYVRFSTLPGGVEDGHARKQIFSRNAMLHYRDLQMPILQFALVFDTLTRAIGHFTVCIAQGVKEALETDPDFHVDEYLKRLLHSLEETDHVKFIMMNIPILEEGPFQDIESLLRHSRLCERLSYTLLSVLLTGSSRITSYR